MCWTKKFNLWTSHITTYSTLKDLQLTSWCQTPQQTWNIESVYYQFYLHKKKKSVLLYTEFNNSFYDLLSSDSSSSLLEQISVIRACLQQCRANKENHYNQLSLQTTMSKTILEDLIAPGYTIRSSSLLTCNNQMNGFPTWCSICQDNNEKYI